MPPSSHAPSAVGPWRRPGWRRSAASRAAADRAAGPPAGFRQLPASVDQLLTDLMSLGRCVAVTRALTDVYLTDDTATLNVPVDLPGPHPRPPAFIPDVHILHNRPCPLPPPVYVPPSAASPATCLAHTSGGTTFCTGQTGTPLDVITFHVKGGGYAADPRHKKQNPPSVKHLFESTYTGYEIIYKYPGYKDLE